VICPAQTANQPCPICEYRKKLHRDPDADEKLIKSLAPKERQLFNVFDPNEPDKGVQIWDISYHLFGKCLDEHLKNADEEDGLDFFYHPKRGKTLKLGVIEESYNGRAFYKVTSILFRDRKEPIDQELLTSTHCLDELLIVMPYEKLKAMFLQTGEESSAGAGDDDAPPAKKKAAPAAEDDDDFPEPVAPKKKAVAPVAEDDDDAPPAPKKKPAPAEDDDDAPPAPKKKAPAPVEDDDDDTPPPAKKKPVPAAEDDDDAPPAKKKPAAPAEDDEEPAPKKKKAAAPADDDEW
jgi:hypothetical protein